MARSKTDTLTLPEQLVLLLVDERGQPRVAMTGALSYALFAAGLLELAERRCVRFEDARLLPGAIHEANDGFLDAILHELRKTTEPEEPAVVLRRLLRGIPTPREWLLAQLLHKLERARAPLASTLEQLRTVAALLRAARVERVVFTREQAEAAARALEAFKAGPERAGTLERVRRLREEELVCAALERAVEIAG